MFILLMYSERQCKLM